jgi:hypothetical protein
MQNLTVHPGGPSPFLLGPAHARPRSHTPTDRSALPVSSTAARYCAAAPHQTSLPSLFLSWHPPPHARTPTFSLLFSPLPRCHRAASSPLALLHSSSRLHSSPTPPLERPSLPTAPRTRTAASGHRQPTLPRGFWPSTATVRHSPVSSSPSYQSLQFLAIFSPSCLSDAAGPHTRRRHPPEPPPH